MKENIFNRTRIEGRLYQHNLKQKVSGENSAHPGTEFISGEIEIATDEAITNIVSVHFTYVTATTAKGKPNATYSILSGIINGQYKSILADGATEATKIAVDSAVGLNEFYSTRGAVPELVSTKRNEGGFVTVLNGDLKKDERERATFDTDIIIYKFRRYDADEERNMPERGVVTGYIMNFRKDFLPVEYTVMHPGAIDYFESLEVSEKTPVFTRVRGEQISQTVVRKVEEQGAFGDYVREYTNTRRDFVITWAKGEPYTLEDGGDITPEDIKKGLADRQTALATIKKNQEEWAAKRANEGSAFSASANSIVNNDDSDFNF